MDNLEMATQMVHSAASVAAAAALDAQQAKAAGAATPASSGPRFGSYGHDAEQFERDAAELDGWAARADADVAAAKASAHAAAPASGAPDAAQQSLHDTLGDDRQIRGRSRSATTTDYQTLLGDDRRGRPWDAGGKGAKHGRDADATDAARDARSVRPRNGPHFDLEQFRQNWRKDLTIDGGGVPCYYQAHCRKWVYVDVTQDTEYVHTTSGRLTIMWWAWDEDYGHYKRVIREGWYPTRFNPNPWMWS